MRRIPHFITFMICLVLAAPVGLPAQVFKKGVGSGRRINPDKVSPAAPSRLKRAAEEETAPADDNRPIRDLVSEPWLSPTGERLVAIVNDRMLGKSELDTRLQLLLADAPEPVGAEDRQAREDERIILAQKIIDDWVMNALLSTEAVRRGFKVSDQEVEEALSKLASESDIPTNTVEQHIRLVGVPQQQLNSEVRDGMLIEKFILSVVRSYDRDYYQKVYDQQPAAFLLPPRARVFHIFRFAPPSMTTRQREQLISDIETLRKELARKKPDYAGLTGKSDTETGLSISDMGWVTANMDRSETMEKLYQAIFSLDKDETSEVVYAGNGYHVVRILEREEGSAPTLDAAMPQIENFLFEKIKRASFEALKPRYKIQMNSGGLSKWREARPGESRPKTSVQAKASPRTALPPPAPSSLEIQSRLKPAAPAGPEIDLEALPASPQ